jgi:hypothetical protein
MRIGEVEVRKIPDGEEVLCQGEAPGHAIVYFNNTPYCAECFGAELLNGDNNRQLVGHLLAGLIKD